MISPEQDQELKLSWDNFHFILTQEFSSLRTNENFVDVTLVSDNKRLFAHQLVLSASSPYFKKLLSETPCKHPVIIFSEGQFDGLRYILEFIYNGEVRVEQSQLPQFMALVKLLQIRGLTDQDPQVQNEYEPKRTSTETKHKLDESDSKDDIQTCPHLKRCRSNVSADSHNNDFEYCNLLEPKMEFLDEPFENTDTRECFKSELPVPQDNSSNREHNQNSIQDLISITGRLKEIQPIKNTLSYCDKPFNESHSSHQLAPTSRGHTESSNSKYLPMPHRHQSSREMSVVLFSPNQSLVRHNENSSKPLLHSLDSRYCHICGKNYSNLSNLRQHIRLIHIPEMIRCPLCDKCFRNKLYLRRHVISFHETNEVEPTKEMSQSVYTHI